MVIIGGGFAGLYAAHAVRRAPARITLIDKRNHHLFQPLLYQVATAGLHASDIAAPVTSLLVGLVLVGLSSLLWLRRCSDGQ